MNHRIRSRSCNESPLANQAGQSLLEYLILVALVVLVCVGASKALGSKLHAKLHEVERQIDEGIPVKLNP